MNQKFRNLSVKLDVIEAIRHITLTTFVIFESEN